MNKHAMWDEYHALLGKVSRMEDNLNVPREARVIKLFQQPLKEEDEVEVPQYGLAMRILLWIKGVFNGSKKEESRD